MSRKVLTISLSKDLATKLEGACEDTDRPRSWLVSEALKGYFEDLEDLEIAYARLHDPREGRLTETALRKKLGLSR